MRRATAVRRAGEWDATVAIDVVALDSSERHRRRIALKGERGLDFLLDLPRATVLHHGDGLLLDDGAIVQVMGKPEPLTEITAANGFELARLAWHIGNRHADLQIVGDKLRIQRDHVLEDMLRGLGARVAPIDAPFDPESAAGSDGNEQNCEHGHTHGHSHAA